MKKILKQLCVMAIVGLSTTQYSHASADDDMRNDKGIDIEENHFPRILQSLVGDNVNITFHDDRNVRFAGSDENIQSALKNLQNFDMFREILLPLNEGDIQTHASRTPIETLQDFMGAIGLNPDDYDYLNTNASTIVTENGHAEFTTDNPFKQKCVRALIEEMSKNSSFFRWAHQNINGLITESDHFTQINFHLLFDYLYLTHTEEPDDGFTTSTISEENLLKMVIAAVHGKIALKPEDNGLYRVHVVSLGDAKSHGEAVLEILVDNSGSMEGYALHQVNNFIPELFQAVQDQLTGDESITIRVKGYDTRENFTFEKIVDRKTPQQGNLNILSRGGTNLTLLGKGLLSKEGERKTAIGFTDGQHNEGDADRFFKDLEAKKRQGQIAFGSFHKVGGGASEFLDRFAEIAGSENLHSGTIDEFSSRVLKTLPELLRDRKPLLLEVDGSNVHVNWIFDDRPGVFITETPVAAGTSIGYGENRRRIVRPATDFAPKKETKPALEGFSSSDLIAMLVSRGLTAESISALIAQSTVVSDNAEAHLESTTDQ